MLKINFTEKNKKYLFPIIFLMIFALGIFLRSFHFGDWLIFQSDQSRDAIIVEKAVDESFSNLPLIGPQARGSVLHLGPIFYYFQYFSGKIFGSRPESFAYPDLFFGILTIPLLYIFLRKFVSKWAALGMAGLASVSFFLVTFSRFAWNPNSLPFFTTLFAWFFISAFQNEKRRLWFFAGAAACLGVIVQLHFVAALSLGLGIFVFLIIFRSLKSKELIACILVVAAFQIPTILYELKNKGAVSDAFLETVEEKGSQDGKHGIHEKVFRAFQAQAENFWLVSTGQQNTSTIVTRGFSLKCDKECRAALPVTFSSFFLFVFLMWVGWGRWKKEEDIIKKKMLAFLGLWFLSFFLVTILVAYQISTRFYLSIVPITFLTLALSVDWFSQLNQKKIFQPMIFAVPLILVSLNFHATKVYLQELSLAGSTPAETNKDIVFGSEPKVTLEELRSIASEADRNFSNPDPIFISGESRYARSVYYILSAEKGRKGCYVKGSVDESISKNQMQVIKNKEQADIIPFGTLAIRFINSEVEKSNALPSECLTY